MSFTLSDLRRCVPAQLSSSRWAHVLRVEALAQEIAQAYPEARSPWFAWAVLAHDATKEWSTHKARRWLRRSAYHSVLQDLPPVVWHGYTAALWLRRKLKQDLPAELEQALCFHSTGLQDGAGALLKVLFLADYLEPAKLARRHRVLSDFWTPSLTLEEVYQKILVSKKSF